MIKNEIFKTVAEHLMKMPKQSINSDGFCRYRGPDGLKCAVGVLIPDDLYEKVDIEGYNLLGVLSFWKDNNISFPYWFKRNLNLLNNLQNLHDQQFDDKVAGLLDIAKEFKIKKAYIPASLLDSKVCNHE